MLHGCILWEGGWDTSVGRSSSILPNCRIFIENPLTGIAGTKNQQKESLVSSLQWKKYAQLLLIRWIWPEAVFLFTCDPSMNKLWATYTGLCIDLYEPRSLTACSHKGHTQLKMWPKVTNSTKSDSTLIFGMRCYWTESHDVKYKET
jgi:hypothetical protein